MTRTSFGFLGAAVSRQAAASRHSRILFIGLFPRVSRGARITSPATAQRWTAGSGPSIRASTRTSIRTFRFALGFGLRFRFRVRAVGRTRLAAAAVVGDVETRALELQCRRENDSFHLAAAPFVHRQRRLGKLLPQLEGLTTSVATVFVKRHTLPTGIPGNPCFYYNRWLPRRIRFRARRDALSACGTG